MNRSLLLSSAAMLGALLLSNVAFAQPPEEGMAPTPPRQSINQRPAGGNYGTVPSGQADGAVNQRPAGSNYGAVPSGPSAGTQQNQYGRIPTGNEAGDAVNQQPGGSNYGAVPSAPRSAGTQQNQYDIIPPKGQSSALGNYAEPPPDPRVEGMLGMSPPPPGSHYFKPPPPRETDVVIMRVGPSNDTAVPSGPSAGTQQNQSGRPGQSSDYGAAPPPAASQYGAAPPANRPQLQRQDGVQSGLNGLPARAGAANPSQSQYNVGTSNGK